MKIDDVKEALAHLRREGKEPSYRAVLAAIGHGSLRDVTRFMQELADPETAGAVLTDVQQLLAPLLPLMTFVQELEVLTHTYHYLLTVVPQELEQSEQRRQALTTTIGQLRQERQQLEAMIDLLQRTVRDLKTELHEVALYEPESASDPLASAGEPH
jgi:hypothetical protein